MQKAGRDLSALSIPLPLTMCTMGNVILEDIALCVYYKIIRASLSEPHIGVTSCAHAYVWLIAWMDLLPKILNQRISFAGAQFKFLYIVP